MKNSRKEFILVLIIFLSYSKSYAEKSDTVKVYKNEIGMDISSLGSLAQGTEFTINGWLLMYKRSFKNPFWDVRLNASVFFPRQYYFYENYKIIAQTLYSQLREIDYSEKSPVYSVKAGIEHRGKKKKFNLVYGTDLCFQNQSSHFESREQWFFLNHNYYSPYRYDSATLLVSQDTKYNKFGICPFIGFRYKISRRFVLTAESSPSILSVFGKTKRDDFINPKLSYQSNFRGFEFEIQRFISNFSLCYLF